MNINKTKLIKDFVDIKNIMNLNMLFCYKNLFTINGVLFNIGSYIIISIFIFHVIIIFIFYLKKYNILKMKVKDIIFSIKNSGLFHKNKIKNKKK